MIKNGIMKGALRGRRMTTEKRREVATAKKKARDDGDDDEYARVRESLDENASEARQEGRKEGPNKRIISPGRMAGDGNEARKYLAERTVRSDEKFGFSSDQSLGLQEAGTGIAAESGRARAPVPSGIRRRGEPRRPEDREGSAERPVGGQRGRQPKR